MAEAKNKLCVWTQESVKAFEALKNALITAPILAFPNFEKDFIVQTDASGYALGGVLLQYDSKNLLRPLGFCSRKLNDTETRYSTTEREMLAIKFAFQQYRNTIEGRNITFYTDHEPLSTLKELKNPNGRLGKMLFSLVMENTK